MQFNCCETKHRILNVIEFKLDLIGCLEIERTQWLKLRFDVCLNDFGISLDQILNSSDAVHFGFPIEQEANAIKTNPT